MAATHSAVSTHAHSSHAGHSHHAKTFSLRITRQDAPGQGQYTQVFRLPHKPQMNIISALQEVAAHPVTADGKPVAPVAWDCNCLEEVCGACTMIINGRVRQACTALVDSLLADGSDEISLEPMTKFPVVRDLVVDRTRMFHALKHVRAWVAVDGYHHAGPGPAVAPSDQEEAYPLSRCMTCGCCMDACPQFPKVELTRHEGESDEDFAERQAAAFDHAFIGPAPISQAVLFNLHPTGRMNAHERLEALMGPGGITDCGNAQNCVKVCPKDIPLTRSIAIAGRQTTLHAIKRWFTR